MKNNKQLRMKVHMKIPRIIIDEIKEDRKLKKLKKKIWGILSLQNAIYLCLYYLIYYPSMKTLELEFGYSHTNFNNLLEKFLKYIQSYSKKKLKPYSKEKCSEISKEKIKKKKFLTELLHDSSDWPLTKRDSLRKKSPYHSFKLNCHGIKYQYSVSNDMRIQFLSKFFLPKKYDSECMQEIRNLFHARFEGGWKILADGHYKTMEEKWKSSHWICPIRKRKNEEFSLKEKNYNRAQKNTRSRIEKVFSDLTQCWGCLKSKWRGSEIKHQEFMFLASAIYNKKRALLEI